MFSSRVCAWGLFSVLVFCGCGQSEDARKLARLESRLAALEHRARPMLDAMARTASLGPDTSPLTVVDTAPPFDVANRQFLGSSNISIGTVFDRSSRKVLAEGAGLIRGRVIADSSPRAGLRLRLFLSGIRTSWATSDTSGTYEIHVPPGKYRYQGYEFDDRTTAEVLPGMIEKERHLFLRMDHAIDALPANPGKGPDFEYATAVTPVAPAQGTTIPRGRVRFEWQPYPGAARYEVTISEGERNGRGGSRMLNWSDPLRTSVPFVVAPPSLTFAPSKSYTWSVTAFDAQDRELSHSPEHYHGRGFFVE